MSWSLRDTIESTAPGFLYSCCAYFLLGMQASVDTPPPVGQISHEASVDEGEPSECAGRKNAFQSILPATPKRLSSVKFDYHSRDFF